MAEGAQRLAGRPCLVLVAEVMTDPFQVEDGRGAWARDAEGRGGCAPPPPHSLLSHLQALRSFKLSVTVDPKYHPKIIGRKGAVITQIRLEHDVNIQFPDKDDGNQVRRTPLESDATVERFRGRGALGGLRPDLGTVTTQT